MRSGLRQINHFLNKGYHSLVSGFAFGRYSYAEDGIAFHGTEYGGWALKADGLTANSVVYSFGIGEDASFDLSLISAYGVNVYAFDPTPKSIAWVNRQSWPASFNFYPIGLGAADRIAEFFPPENPDHVSHTILNRQSTAANAIKVEIHRLKTIAEMLDHQHIDILKMDIEGAEYEVIDDLIDSPEISVYQVLVEFHHFFPEIPVERTQKALKKLTDIGYRVFHVSDRGLEYGLVRP